VPGVNDWPVGGETDAFHQWLSWLTDMYTPLLPLALAEMVAVGAV
jgi:hypothetical protein